MPHRAVAKRAFHNLLMRSVILPVVLMGILAAVLIWQIGRLVESSRYVERTDQVIASIYLIEKLHIDMESGMRGFLLRGQDPMLDPYYDAKPRLSAVFDELREQYGSRSTETHLLNDIRAESTGWVNYSTAQIERRRSGGDWVTPVDEFTGKRQMDSIRAKFRTLLDTEVALRAKRNAETSRSALVTMIGAGGLTLLIGVLISFVARGQLHWLAQTYETALARAQELSSDLERRVDERTRELSSANGQLHEANRELEAFAYSISHDLRAPMRHISGFADLLRLSAGPKLGEEDSENLETIRRTALLAGRMVDDLLSFSRIGRTQLKVSPVDMNLLLRDARAALAPDTRDRTIEWVVDSDLRPTVGDASLLKLAVQNLLSNAIKYSSHRERPRIEVGNRPEGDGTTYWVRDNGVGFDMAYVHKLFGVFQRLHRAEEFEGTGIGLANVRRIIVRHGGQVWAEGLPDAGAAFYFHLPDQPPLKERQTNETLSTTGEQA